MKLFERTPGYWLFYISAAYLLVGVWSIYNGADLLWMSPLYIFFLSMPFWFPPLGRAINLDVTWDQKMFDFFRFIKKNDKASESSNVVKFPEPKSVPTTPEVKPPEKPATVFYRLGLTDNNRVAFSMGYSEITMNQAGVDNLIQQLQVFRNQLHDEDNGTNNDPDGGLPLPEEVPYDKAA